jgi:hypothetical protein
MGMLDSLKATVGLGDPAPAGAGASSGGLPTHAPPPPPAAPAKPGFLDNIKTRIGLAEPAPPPPSSLPASLLASATRALDQHTPKLTWQQRAIGFGICLGVGLLLSFLVRAAAGALRGGDGLGQVAAGGAAGGSGRRCVHPGAAAAVPRSLDASDAPFPPPFPPSPSPRCGPST